MKESKLFMAAAFAIASAALLSSCAGMPGAGGTSFQAHLSPAKGAQSQAGGDATFQFSADGASLTFTLRVSNLVDVTMAHVHVSSTAGQPGDVAVWLYPPKAPPVLKPGSFSGVLAQGTITAADLEGPLANGSVADLMDRITKGLAYVNVHTNRYPDGEIQGTISASAPVSNGPMQGGHAY